MGPPETPAYAAAFAVADSSAAGAQRLHLQLTRVELALLVLGAATGFLDLPVGSSRVDLGGILATALFVLSLTLRAYRLTVRPIDTWQGGRAAAESIKTLCWKYAVGSRTFPAGMADADADAEFVSRLREVLESIRGIDTAAAADGGSLQITPWMRDLRGTGLDDRRGVYERARIEDQERWYAGRARFNQRQTRRWAAVILLFELFGAVAGALKAFDVLNLSWSTGDLVGVAAALGAAASAWAQTRQYATLTSAYRIAHEELSAIRALVRHQVTEPAWEDFVDSTEGAISREHTMWRASRT